MENKEISEMENKGNSPSTERIKKGLSLFIGEYGEVLSCLQQKYQNLKELIGKEENFDFDAALFQSILLVDHLQFGINRTKHLVEKLISEFKMPEGKTCPLC